MNTLLSDVLFFLPLKSFAISPFSSCFCIVNNFLGVRCSEGPKPVATPRPDRLVNRLKSITLDDASAPRLVIVRQPRGPDNSKVRAILSPFYSKIYNIKPHLIHACEISL